MYIGHPKKRTINNVQMELCGECYAKVVKVAFAEYDFGATEIDRQKAQQEAEAEPTKE